MSDLTCLGRQLLELIDVQAGLTADGDRPYYLVFTLQQLPGVILLVLLLGGVLGDEVVAWAFRLRRLLASVPARNLAFLVGAVIPLQGASFIKVADGLPA